MNFRYTFAVFSLLILPCLLLLTGCPADPIEVTVSDCSAKNLTLQLSQGRNFYSGQLNPPQITAIWFDRGTEKATDLWSIESNEFVGKAISTLTYGTIPAGFKGSQAKSLQAGSLVHIEIRGIGSKSFDVTICK